MFSPSAFTSKSNSPGALIFGKQPDTISLERYTVILPPYDRGHPIKKGVDEGAIMIIESIDETNHLIYDKWSTQTNTPAQFINVQINNNLVVNNDATIKNKLTVKEIEIQDGLEIYNSNSKDILVSDGSKFNPVEMSGDAIIDETGKVTVNSMTDSAKKKGNLLISDSSEMKSKEMSGDATIDETGTITVNKVTDASTTANTILISDGTDFIKSSFTIPTSDPGTKGVVYQDGGFLKVSEGSGV